MAIDDKIPFIEYFIVPYFLWFAYVAVAVLYFLFKNKGEYYRLCAFLFTGMTIFLIISTVYPNGHYLRPATFAHDNIFCLLYTSIHQHLIEIYQCIFPNLCICKISFFYCRCMVHDKTEKCFCHDHPYTDKSKYFSADMEGFLEFVSE